MNCDHIQKALSAYLDREVPAWEKTNISLHLSQCARCHELLEGLILVKQSIRSLPMPRMPEDLRNQIEGETIQRETTWEGWAAWRWWLPTLTFAAGAAAWFFLHSHPSPGSLHVAPEIVKGPAEKVIAMHRVDEAPQKSIQ